MRLRPRATIRHVSRALVAVVLVSTLAAGTALASRARPSLDVVTIHPVKVHGTGFRPAERTRVVLVVSDHPHVRHIRRVTAGREGSFVASFAGLSVGRCDAFVVVAKGTRGSSAVVKRGEVPADCPGPSLDP